MSDLAEQDAGVAAQDVADVEDATEALAAADPQEQALDALADYLSTLQVETGDAAELQALEASLDEPEEGAQDESSHRRRAEAGRHRHSEAEQEGELESDALGVVVAEDRLSAVITRLDQRSTLRQVARALKRENVRFGIQVEDLKQAVARARGGEVQTDVLAAVGTPAEPGRDACFEWEVETGARAGTILEDGTIDLRDRRLITVVKEGQRLGCLRPAAEGTPGRDVQGRVIAPSKPRSLTLVPGANVRIDASDDGTTTCFAEAEGGVAHEEGTQKGRPRLKISVSKVSRIEQDIDYATGHVDFDGEVVITGSVKALFNVRATGSVSVEGNVEAGARIEAGSNLLIGGGVVGEETRLIAGGNLMCKFLQGCSVRAGGDVEIGAYVFEASLRCAGRLKVNGMGEGSGRALVGGLVWAGKGIETPSLGSPTNPRIRLVVGVDPQIVDQAEALRTRLRKIDERRKALLSRLGLDQFDVKRIKAILQKTQDPDERSQKVALVQELTKLGETVKHGRERLAELVRAEQASARTADLVVEGTVFPGAEIRLGDQLCRVREETRSRRYRLLEEEGDLVLRDTEL